MMVLETIKMGLFSFLIFFLYAGVFVVVMGCVIYLLEMGEWDPASGQYLIESGFEPHGRVVSQFQSVIDAMWFVVATTTTVGYGDRVPVTNSGKIAGVVTIYGGVILLALPLSIIGGTFNDIYYKKKYERDAKKELLKHNAMIVLTVLDRDNSMNVVVAFRRWYDFMLRYQTPEVQQLEFQERLMQRIQDLEDKMMAVLETSRS